MARSTVPAGIAVQTHAYLAAGGGEKEPPPALRLLCDTPADDGVRLRLAGGHPVVGFCERRRDGCLGGEEPIPHRLSRCCTTGPSTSPEHRLRPALCAAIRDAGGRPPPVYCTSLRNPDRELLSVCQHRRHGGHRPLLAGATPPAPGPVAPTTRGMSNILPPRISRSFRVVPDQLPQRWSVNDDGLSPLDVATQVAVPEFDGRIITVLFSFARSTTTG